MLHRCDIDQHRKMVFRFALVAMIVALSISKLESAYREVSTDKTTLADIREGLVLLRNVANGSKVGLILKQI